MRQTVDRISVVIPAKYVRLASLCRLLRSDSLLEPPLISRRAKPRQGEV
jgi:hypothetical protein